MFGKVASLFGSKPPPPPPSPGPQLGMPLFAAASPIASDAVVTQWAALFPREPPLRVETPSGPESPVQYGVGGMSLMAIHIPMPVPNDEAVHAVKTSWMWQQPDNAVSEHVAHAIVTAVPGAGRSAAMNKRRRTWPGPRLVMLSRPFVFPLLFSFKLSPIAFSSARAFVKSSGDPTSDPMAAAHAGPTTVAM